MDTENNKNNYFFNQSDYLYGQVIHLNMQYIHEYLLHHGKYDAMILRINFCPVELMSFKAENNSYKSIFQIQFYLQLHAVCIIYKNISKLNM
jgi:hypothetical protein